MLPVLYFGPFAINSGTLLAILNILISILMAAKQILSLVLRAA